MFVPVFGNEQDYCPPGWQLVDVFPCLGHLLTPSGSIQPCYTAATSVAWRAFLANVGGPKAGALPTSLRIDQLERVVKPIIFYRASRWPFTLTVAKKLDRLQRRMLRLCVKVSSLPSDTPETYGRRAARVVSSIQVHIGSWGVLWAERIITWSAHHLRNTDGACWASRILTIRSTHELNVRRSQQNARPLTRVSSEFVNRRWTDSIVPAIDYVRSQESKPRTPYGSVSVSFLRSLPARKSFPHSILEFVENNLASL